MDAKRNKIVKELYARLRTDGTTKVKCPFCHNGLIKHFTTDALILYGKAIRIDIKKGKMLLRCPNCKNDLLVNGLLLVRTGQLSLESATWDNANGIAD